MEINSNEHNWKILYKIGSIAVFLTVLVMFAEIIITMLPDGSRSNSGVDDIYGWFDLFDRNWFMAMRNLGLINIIADNVAFPMLALSQKHSVADPASRELLAAAGEALLAKGTSHTPGTFPGFFLSEVSAILFSIIIIKGNAYKKNVGILGVFAFSMMLIFEVISSFFTEFFSIAMIFASLGGITALIWYILMGLGMYNASKSVI